MPQLRDGHVLLLGLAATLLKNPSVTHDSRDQTHVGQVTPILSDRARVHPRRGEDRC